MAEYWKSQPKKFCEFCKVWITDNKPSIEFHERGKKHQENTKRKISEVQKKGRDAQKANEQRKKDLEAIEAAALKAYQKDLEELNKQSSDTSEKSLKDDNVKSDDKKAPPVPLCVIIYHGTEPVAHCNHGWNVGKSTEGHYYYYNSSTNSSQWHLPQCMAKTVGETSPDSSTTSNDKQDREVKEPESKGKQNENLTKESLTDSKSSKDTMEETYSHSSPYGKWTTVVTYSTQSESTSEGQSSERNTAGPNSPNQQNKETGAVDDTKPAKPLFKERVAPKLNVGKGDSGEVAFKKRKLNSEKKRNIRRTEFAT